MFLFLIHASKNQKIECELWVATKLKNGWLQGTQVHPMFFSIKYLPPPQICCNFLSFCQGTEPSTHTS